MILDADLFDLRNVGGKGNTLELRYLHLGRSETYLYVQGIAALEVLPFLYGLPDDLPCRILIAVLLRNAVQLDPLCQICLLCLVVHTHYIDHHGVILLGGSHSLCGNGDNITQRTACAAVLGNHLGITVPEHLCQYQGNNQNHCNQQNPDDHRYLHLIKGADRRFAILQILVILIVFVYFFWILPVS